MLYQVAQSLALLGMEEATFGTSRPAAEETSAFHASREPGQRVRVSTHPHSYVGINADDDRRLKKNCLSAPSHTNQCTRRA